MLNKYDKYPPSSTVDFFIRATSRFLLATIFAHGTKIR